MRASSILFYFFLFLWNFSWCQHVQLKIHFHDASTQKSIDSVYVTLRTSKNVQLFDDWVNNKSTMEIPGDHSIIKCQIKKDEYKTIDTVLHINRLHVKSIRKKRKIDLYFSLHYEGVSFHKVEVSAYYKPAVAFSSKRISVSDFVVVNTDTLLLLTYPKRLSKSSDLVWFVNGRIVATQPVPGTAIKLEIDYKRRIFLRCKDHDYLVSPNKNIHLTKVSTKKLEKFIEPVLDTFNNQSLYYTTYNDYYPAFDYYRVDLSDTSQHKIHHIEDKIMMEQYRAEFKWVDVRTKLWAWDMESETGIDRRIWVGANYFTRSIYWEPPHGNLFLVNDSVLVFDYYKNKCYKFLANHDKAIDSVPISFHKKQHGIKWEKKMLQDPITKKIYTLYNDGGYIYLYEINPITGKKENKMTLFYRYPEDIQVYNEKVYYIYRPFGSIQQKYLYKEDLVHPNQDFRGQNRFEKKH